MVPSLIVVSMCRRAALASASMLLAGCSAAPELLDGPTHAIVASDGLVYVTDGYFHARVAVFRPEGQFVRDWGSKGFELGQLQTPHALVEASEGTLVIADRDNGRLQSFTTGGQLVDSLRSAALGRPWSVAKAADGTLFVADGGDQREDAERAGIVQLGAGNQVVRRFGSFGHAPGELDEPHMLAASRSREVFVVDLGNRRLQRFAPARCEAAGACDYEPVVGWPALADTPGLDPLSVAVDEERVYVGHQGDPSSIWVLEQASGRLEAVIGEGVFQRPHGLFIDLDGTLWVADDKGNQVVHLTAEGHRLVTIGSP
jgi:DNA-binding beta-propeller fold protein YncE